MMNLHFETAGAGPPLVILHGLLGSADNWRSMSRSLGAHYKVFAVDLRNHGRSPHSDVFDYDVMVADLWEFIQRQSLTGIRLLGHSMGGKVAMHFAIDNAEAVDKLVVLDTAPKPYESSQRDLLQALRTLDLTRYNSFGAVDGALAAQVPDAALRQFLVKNLARENGRLRWKIHLEALYRNYDKLARGLKPERPFDKPTLFIRGGRSNYVEDADMPLIRRIFPRAEMVTVPGTGHWVHVDRPAEFFAALVNFLTRP
jgi:pimeloyl-ACP methyl ester carboxylesterase